MQLSKLSISIALVCAVGAMAAPDNGGGDVNLVRIGHDAPAPASASSDNDESSKDHEESSMDHDESSKDEAALDESTSETDTGSGASGLMSSFVGLAIAGGVSVLVSAF